MGCNRVLHCSDLKVVLSLRHRARPGSGVAGLEAQGDTRASTGIAADVRAGEAPVVFGLENETCFDLPDQLWDIDQTLDLIEFEYFRHCHVSRV